MANRVIWGFPGIGKSFASNDSILDVDCMLFEFTGVDDASLHGNKDNTFIDYNSEYPNNYINYVNNIKADIVLINCHLSLLSFFPNVEIIYPAKELKEEYLLRYKNRGDHDSFIEYMSDNFTQMVDYIEKLPYKKYKLVNKDMHLTDILNTEKREGLTMAGFMTKSDLITLINASMKLDVFPKNLYDTEVSDAEKIAEDLFNGRIKIDLDQLQNEVDQAKKTYGSQYIGHYALQKGNDVSVIKVTQARDAVWVLERFDETENKSYGFKFFEKEERFKTMLQDGYKKSNLYDKIGSFRLNDLEGYSHDEAVSIIANSIASGVIKVSHGQIYPYTYGYELKYKDLCFKPGGSLFELAEKVVQNLKNNKVEKQVFGPHKYAYNQLSLNDLKKETEEKMKAQPKNIIPDKQTEYCRHRKTKPHWERTHIATYQDIDEGKSVDGIAAGFYGGDYSSMTTNGQNELMRVLVALRGYCLDYVHEVSDFPYRSEIIQFYEKKGIDIATEKGINDWIKSNPGKCALEKNRIQAPKLNDVIKKKSEQKDSINQGTDKIIDDEIKR